MSDFRQFDCIRAQVRSLVDCCGDGVAEATAPLGRSTSPEQVVRPEPAEQHSDAENFEQFIYRVWGAGVARHFAIPYNRKLWAVPLAEMETSWLGGRVPMPDLDEMIEGALQPVAKPQGPNARFGYPLRGGFQALMNGFLPLLEGDLLTRRQGRANRSAPSQGHAGRRAYLPLPAPDQHRAIALASGDARKSVPPRVAAAGDKLRHVSVRCVNLGVGREKISEKHWIYYPEDTVFHRIFVQGNASPHCNPPGGFGLTCEITYSPHKPLPCDGDALVERCIRDCIDVGMLRADDPILVRNQVDMPYAYVVYDHDRKACVDTIREWLKSQDIHLSGRYSEWEYYNSDHAFIAGRNAADQVRDADRAAIAESAAMEVIRSEPSMRLPSQVGGCLRPAAQSGRRRQGRVAGRITVSSRAGSRRYAPA
jgi:UDP-galactopyranose mutase